MFFFRWTTFPLWRHILRQDLYAQRRTDTSQAHPQRPPTFRVHRVREKVWKKRPFKKTRENTCPTQGRCHNCRSLWNALSPTAGNSYDRGSHAPAPRNDGAVYAYGPMDGATAFAKYWMWFTVAPRTYVIRILSIIQCCIKKYILYTNNEVKK